MDRWTLKALRASIEHWRENAAAQHPDEIRLGAGYCALCAEFNRHDNFCKGCPVLAKTGKPFCDATPYANVQALHDCWELSGDDSYREPFQTAARDMLAFLESLQPEGE